MIASYVIAKIDPHGLFKFLREVEDEFRELKSQSLMFEVVTRPPGFVYLQGNGHELVVYITGGKLFVNELEISPTAESKKKIADMIVEMCHD